MSRLEISPKKKLVLRIPEDIHTTHIELYVHSAGVIEVDEVFFPEHDEETEEQPLQREQDARNEITRQLPDTFFETFSAHYGAYPTVST